jgi:hypothetical protein
MKILLISLVHLFDIDFQQNKFVTTPKFMPTLMSCSKLERYWAFTFYTWRGKSSRYLVSRDIPYGILKEYMWLKLAKA